MAASPSPGFLDALPWAAGGVGLVGPVKRPWLGWLLSQARRVGDMVGVRPGRRAGAAGSLEDREEFEALYFQMADRLLIFFGRRTADPELARDLWAETWARAYEGRQSFRGRVQEQREGWIIGIARNVLASFYKKGEVEAKTIDRLKLERPELSDRDLDRLERVAGFDDRRAELREALYRLSDEQRDAVHYRIVEGLPYEEIAERMGGTEVAARARVSRGLKALHKHLDKRDIKIDLELGGGAEADAGDGGGAG